jgi:hypothetical protein
VAACQAGTQAACDSESVEGYYPPKVLQAREGAPGAETYKVYVVRSCSDSFILDKYACCAVNPASFTGRLHSASGSLAGWQCQAASASASLPVSLNLNASAVPGQIPFKLLLRCSGTGSGTPSPRLHCTASGKCTAQCCQWLTFSYKTTASGSHGAKAVLPVATSATGSLSRFNLKHSSNPQRAKYILVGLFKFYRS